MLSIPIGFQVKLSGKSIIKTEKKIILTDLNEMYFSGFLL